MVAIQLFNVVWAFAKTRIQQILSPETYNTISRLVLPWPSLMIAIVSMVMLMHLWQISHDQMCLSLSNTRDVIEQQDKIEDAVLR